MLIQKVFNSIVHKIMFDKAHKKARKNKLSEDVISLKTFLEKNIPKITPSNAFVSVNPGKYAPIGNKIAPIKSERAPTAAPANGPYNIPANATATKASPIFWFHTEKERNLDNTTSIAVKTERVEIINIDFVLFFKKTPPNIICLKVIKRRHQIYYLQRDAAVYRKKFSSKRQLPVHLALNADSLLCEHIIYLFVRILDNSSIKVLMSLNWR